jgi:superoxide dismutase, Fe-Mn family
MAINSESGIERRALFAVAAAGAAAIVTASSTAEALEQAPAAIKPIALPEKVYNTAKAGISRKTHDEHYELYKGYVAKVNEIKTKLAALTPADLGKANASFSDLRELKTEYTFALGGARNHELYFGHLGGNGGDPAGAVADAIKASFGSVEAWKADFKATALAARGWVWLAIDRQDGTLFNYIGDSQNSYPVWNAVPILAIDMYEHAFYLDFGRAKAKYIDAFFSVIDWDAVNANLASAVAARKA